MHRTKLIGILIISIVSLLTFLAGTPRNSYALANCSIQNSQSNYKTGDTINLNAGDLDKNKDYNIIAGGYPLKGTVLKTFNSEGNNSATINFQIPSIDTGNYDIWIQSDIGADTNVPQGICQRNVKITNNGAGAPPPPSPNCSISTPVIGKNQNLTVTGSHLTPKTFYVISLDGNHQGGSTTDSDGLFNRSFKPNISSTATIPISLIESGTNSAISCGTFTYNSNVGAAGAPGVNPCATPDPQDPEKIIVKECQTALGPISTDPSTFIGRIMKIAIGLAGGIALIFMVMGAIKILTSAGDPKKVTDGRDMIIAAVSGLLFLILSVLILRFIGTNLLGGVPGL